MKNTHRFAQPARPFVRLAAISALFLAAAGVTMADSLLLKEQGSFFVGGRTIFTDALTGSTTGFLGSGINSGKITVDQMYVQYQIPEGADAHVPVVMVHGCCLSSKSYETTPDGRMGWNEYFLRKHRSVYLPDQVSRAFRIRRNDLQRNQIRETPAERHARASHSDPRNCLAGLPLRPIRRESVP